jgi:hypothetical protein
MQPHVGRAVMEGRTMLMHGGSLRSCDGESWAQAGNQCKCDRDFQFHTASFVADRTRERDARIHEFVVLRAGTSLRTNLFFRSFERFLASLRLRGMARACIFAFKMSFASGRFVFTFRYWRSFGSVGAASAE